LLTNMPTYWLPRWKVCHMAGIHADLLAALHAFKDVRHPSIQHPSKAYCKPSCILASSQE
jgi:hypothetical protein